MPSKTLSLPSCFSERFPVVRASRGIKNLDGVAAAIGVTPDHLGKVLRGGLKPSPLLFNALRQWMGDEAWAFCHGESDTLRMPAKDGLPVTFVDKRKTAPPGRGHAGRGRERKTGSG